MDSGITVNPSLDISTRTVGGVTIAELAGELDIESAPALREQLLSLLSPGSSRLVIDLSKVSSCDASGLAVLVGTGRRARLLGGFMRLAAVSPQAARVLHITGLHRHLPVSSLSTQPEPGPLTPSTGGQAQSPRLPLPSGGSGTPGAGPFSAETERAVTGGARSCSAPAAGMSLAQPQRMRLIALAA
jgi:anti-sigma B factor antagonist